MLEGPRERVGHSEYGGYCEGAAGLEGEGMKK